MQEEFLNNECAGQTLLRLVARGSSINTELLRLSDHIPEHFISVNESKYSEILFDFSYFGNIEYHENIIESNQELFDLDEEFREAHLPMLERFYQLFDSICKYINDYNTYINEMIEGIFVEYTIEGVLMDNDGRQLLTEALALYGIMLLLLDHRIAGITRERLIVAYYRCKGSSLNNIDDVVKLCSNTGYGTNKKPKDYPCQYFARFPIDKEITSMIISKFRSEDLYLQTKAYPSPRHRSMALSTQSSLLYVLLYFAPDILHGEFALMRELVDKHFNDNWIVPYYIGLIHDLSISWEPFKAAKSALNNTLDKSLIITLVKNHTGYVGKCLSKLKEYLVEGILTEQFVLDNTNALLNCLRDCNVTLHWLMLHRSCNILKLISQNTSQQEILLLLLNTAQFEFVLKNIFKDLISCKVERWNGCQKEVVERLQELSEYFSGTKALTRIKQDKNLQDWFSNLAKEAEALNNEKITGTGRKIALIDVEEFHQIDSNNQIKQFLADTRMELNKMIKIANINENILATVNIVSDLTYAWEIIGDYITLIHNMIKENPSCVLLLRATFLKFLSILDLPLVRINQCGSKDVESVAEYYSGVLVSFIRSVLQVIPQSMFIVLNKIIKILTSDLIPLPMKLEVIKLKEYTQMEQRYQLAKATNQISVFTEGILAMETTLVGIVQIDPKQLLEDGIRKELVIQIATALHEQLIFPTGKLADFKNKLTILAKKLDGFKLAFEYIQDYLNIYGLKLWQQEFCRIINYNVEQESNQYLKQKIYDLQSIYQDFDIPIPVFSPTDKHSINFCGRLVHELLRLTNARDTIYVDALQGWLVVLLFNIYIRYDHISSHEVVGISTFEILSKTMGIFGLCGIDLLICFMIVRKLQHFVTFFQKNVTKNLKNFINDLEKELFPSTHNPQNSTQLYKLAISKTSKLIPFLQGVITEIGHAQLMRRHIVHELNFSCTLSNFNNSLLNDVRAHYVYPDSKPYPGADDNPILAELSKYLDCSGISSPFHKIYITSEPLDGIACVLFLFVLHEVSLLVWNQKLGALVSKSKDLLDGAPLIVGLITILKQFHNDLTNRFISYFGQYVRSLLNEEFSKDSNVDELPQEVRGVLLFLEEFCKFSKIPRRIVESYLPPYIFDRFNHM